MDCDGNDANELLCEVRSDLLQGQKWNVRVNDLMIYDRDVDNRAEEFNYLQQTGEAQYTIPPSMFEKRSAGQADRPNYVANDDVWVDAVDIAYNNETGANNNGSGNLINTPGEPFGDKVGDASRVKQGVAITKAHGRRTIEGRMNYLGVNLARYKAGGDSPLNAMRVGSTPIIFTLTRIGANDAKTTKKNGTAYFWVEYLKMMNLKNGQISVMDM